MKRKGVKLPAHQETTKTEKELVGHIGTCVRSRVHWHISMHTYRYVQIYVCTVCVFCCEEMRPECLCNHPEWLGIHV